jgi:ribosome biogenesis GTPase
MVESRQGLVVRSAGGFTDVALGDEIVRCRMRGRLKQAQRRTDLCVIGDRVSVGGLDGTPVIDEVLPRRSRFSRLHPGRGPRREDVLIANLDQLFVTFSFGLPRFNPRLLDRFLVIAEHQHVDPLIVMNKADLKQASDLEWTGPYEAIGYPILCVSAETGEGMQALRGALKGKISAFVGPSGVGKSSLLNRILPRLELEVAEVSRHHGKGRHTTRVATLYALDGDAFLADTPGIRELGTWALPLEELDQCFPDFAGYREQCAFRTCSHTHEPGCAVRLAVQDGNIDEGRYQSYQRLHDDATGLTGPC